MLDGFRRPFLTPRLVHFPRNPFLASFGPARALHLNRGSDTMLPIKEAIVDKLRGGPCSLGDVVTHLSSCSTTEIFVAIDRMSRDGRVLLRQLGHSTYQLQLHSTGHGHRSVSGETGRSITTHHTQRCRGPRGERPVNGWSYTHSDFSRKCIKEDSGEWCVGLSCIR